MGQKKLIRFAELLTFPNVLQYPQQTAGTWRQFFKNEHPLVLELACGKGEYALGLGRLFPDRNFLGIDVKGNRLWVGAKKALAEGLNNVAFMRTQIDQIEQYFAPGEVSEIWITFPDPQLRLSRAKKRLTHPRYLRQYQRFLKPGGAIHLKTDSPVLYRFTKAVIALHQLPVLTDTDNLYADLPIDEVLNIRTHYEQLDIAQSQRVHYLQFQLPALPLPNRDEALKEIIFESEADGRG